MHRLRLRVQLLFRFFWRLQLQLLLVIVIGLRNPDSNRQDYTSLIYRNNFLKNHRSHAYQIMDKKCVIMVKSNDYHGY